MINAKIENESVGTQTMIFPVMPEKHQKIEINGEMYNIADLHWTLDASSEVMLVLTVKPAGRGKVTVL